MNLFALSDKKFIASALAADNRRECIRRLERLRKIRYVLAGICALAWLVTDLRPDGSATHQVLSVMAVLALMAALEADNRICLLKLIEAFAGDRTKTFLTASPSENSK